MRMLHISNTDTRTRMCSVPKTAFTRNLQGEKYELLLTTRSCNKSQSESLGFGQTLVVALVAGHPLLELL